jgi:hypothetical protein
MTIEDVQDPVIGNGVAGKNLARTPACAPRQSDCSKQSGRVSRNCKCSSNALVHATSHLRRVLKEKEEEAT